MVKIQVTQQTLDFITGWEGFQAEAYWDYQQWTIGYGTKSSEGACITQEQAAHALGIDLSQRAVKLGAQIYFTPTANQTTALLSAAFNLGTVPSMVIEYCNAGEYSEAATELRKYCHAGGKKLPALVRRREAEARLLESETMSRGAPRVQYNRVYHVLPQNASIDQAAQIAREAHEARETIGYSYDDAGVGDLDSRTVMLHGEHPDNITDWYLEHYPGVQVVLSDQPAPKPPQKPSGEHVRALVGLHGSADGSWGNPILPEAVEQVKRGRIEAYKSLSNESPDTVKILRDINEDIFIMVRLMGKVNKHDALATEFVQQVASDARKWWNAGVRHFEVHNEPNLEIEGWKTAWHDGGDFAAWMLRVINDLEEDLPGAKFGYPGLSPGFTMPIRYDPLRFYEESWKARERADFICAHCYFTNRADMTSLDGGNWYKRYDTQGKPLMITEFSNPTDESKEEKGKQYVDYYKQLEGVHSAYSFIVSASASFDKETWVGSPIASIVGQRDYE
jgi:lysozyme